MERLPFGIRRLDTIIDGGAPPGSVVLLAGEPGAGAREFLYTSAVMNAVYHGDPELFDLNYGDLVDNSSIPPEIHYLSFTESQTDLERELNLVISEELVEAGFDWITIKDFSHVYFQLSPVPRSWYASVTQRLEELGGRSTRADTFGAMGDYLDEHAEGNLVVIDSLSDLAAVSDEEYRWNNIAMLVKGLRRAARSWNSLILLLVDIETMVDSDFGQLMASTDATIMFEWAAGGNELDRTMVVREFRGVLPEIEEEDIIRFETEIGDAGFDITDIRKIR